MKQEMIELKGIKIKSYSLNTIVIGSGAAGFNTADRLYTFGQRDIAIVTEGCNMGTSRNTGSDKQTYYKQTLSGGTQDSIYDMAKTLFEGGSMDGEIAMVEAALSARCFYHLVDIGVPFPHNKYGEYIGYKTDHDPRQRATSAGPLTSKLMTEKLQEQVINKDIKIFDGYQIIGILTNKERSVGAMALNLNSLECEGQRYALFNATNIIYATGGPAGMYDTSVYPESQTGASGIAFEAGVMGKNLTESQFGIASTKFRWNLSGTYQQVLPRYVSTDYEGNDEREFLCDYFNSPAEMLEAVFLKGYQWPFDPRKVGSNGSSLIDILVYNETVIKKRRVFLDYTKNTAWGSINGDMDFSQLGSESYNYLKNSGALFGKPIDRLLHMNEPAVILYKDHGIDITQEYLEIAVCVQHNNGGLYGNIWWESNIKHFFPVGEVNGSHGVYRPGGSALNSGQVGSTRAAEYIAAQYNDEPLPIQKFIEICACQIENKIEIANMFILNAALDKNMLQQEAKESKNASGMCSNRLQQDTGRSGNVLKLRRKIGIKMTEAGAHIRSLEKAFIAAENAMQEFKSIKDSTVIESIKDLPYAFQNYDLLIAEYVYLSSIINYIKCGGKSRGSYLIYDKNGTLPVETLPEIFRFSLDSGALSQKIQTVTYKNGNCTFNWMDVSPVPNEDDWFETIWNAYRLGQIVK